MRINGSAYVVDLSRSREIAAQRSDQGAVQAAPAPGRARSADRVEISPKARELQRLKGDLASLPDVRLDQVALAKQNLQSGGYRVDPGVLAQSMMDSFDARYIKGDGA